jgi:hypothetical protein
VVAGLGGRPIPAASLSAVLDRADRLPSITFLDLDTDVVDRELRAAGGVL